MALVSPVGFSVDDRFELDYISEMFGTCQQFVKTLNTDSLELNRCVDDVVVAVSNQLNLFVIIIVLIIGSPMVRM